MPRVYEVARELGLTSEEVLGRLARLGEPTITWISPLDDELAERLRRDVREHAWRPSTPELPGDEVEGSSPEAAETLAVAPATEKEDEARPMATPKAEEPKEPEKTEKPEKPEKPGKTKRARKSFFRHLAELPVLIVLALVIAVVIKTFLIQAFFIPSGSMFPTLHVGDRVLVEKVSYLFGGPSRGDVVVFEKEAFGPEPDVPWHDDVRNFVRELLGLPTGQSHDFIKRIVAVEGDTIRYAGTPRTLFVNGETVDERYIRGGRDRTSSTVTSDDCERLEMEPSEGGCEVPAGMIFVMGDNRANSEDSRLMGPVDEDDVVGKALLIIWPPGDFGTV